MAKQQTQKKVKCIGTQQYLNVSTGEIEDFQVTSVEERDFNFHKVWMRNFISTLDIVGNQKTKLCFWIIDNLNKDNQLCMTYRQISKESGISLETVRVTMNLLINSNFIKRYNQGCYVVNPDVIYKGTRTGRLNVLNTYASMDVEKPEIPVSEQIKNLQSTINALTKQLKKLTGNDDFSEDENVISEDEISDEITIDDIDEIA